MLRIVPVACGRDEGPPSQSGISHRKLYDKNFEAAFYNDVIINNVASIENRGYTIGYCNRSPIQKNRKNVLF